MALEDLFVRDLDGGLDFVANRETGKWVLTNEKDISRLEDLNNNSIPKSEFNGVSMTVLNVGRNCNLDCIYCHIDPEKTHEKMSVATGRNVIDKISELEERDRLVIFHGSEPLLNYDLIKDLVKYGKTKGISRFGMQTNGTLLDEDMIKYFKDNNVGIGISIDGLKKHHDKTRPFVCGKSSYKLVTENISKVINIIGGVSVITVVGDNNVSDLEIITKDFKEKGINSVRFSPLYSTGEGEDHSPNLDIFTDQMKKIYDSYLEELYAGKNPIKISNFQEIFRTIFSPKETTNCTKCSSSSRHPLIGVDIGGEIYPCDFFWGRKDYRVGNISNNSILEGVKSEDNFRNYRDFGSLEDCSSCDWKTFCGAGCPGSSVMRGKGILSKDPYCEYTKAMLEYTISKIPKLYEKNLIDKILND